MNRGKSVIIIILLVAVVLATFAWWHRWTHSRQVLLHWGPVVSTVIRSGAEVQLLRLGDVSRLGDSATDTEQLYFGGIERAILETVDISDAPGLIHARHHFVHEKGFLWDQSLPPGATPAWDFAIRFRGDGEVATIVLDFLNERAFLMERNKDVGMAPVAKALRAFLDDVIGSRGIVDSAARP